MAKATLPAGGNQANDQVERTRRSSMSESANAQTPAIGEDAPSSAAKPAFDLNFVSEAGQSDRAVWFETSSKSMKAVLEAAYKLAFTSAPVLLTGEHGVGKSMLARQIHKWGPSREQAFVVVNCASSSSHSLTDELFDQVLESLAKSCGECCQSGDPAKRITVFLDNISDLSDLRQARLLRFIEEQNFQSVFRQSSGYQARILAASDRNLAAEVATERFRADLFFRISVISLEIPPLRERPEDILPLAECLLSNVSLRHERPGLEFSPAARAALTRRKWLGNLSELRDIIERAVLLAHNDSITSRLLSKAIAAKKVNVVFHQYPSLEETERWYIRGILARAGSLRQAASMLGIHLSTLWRKRRRYN